ncbi:nephrin isoform X3 [Frankliniella occidentalis]|uniref:Nephrin isoform X3 n=1 Tax=Frankliniella occidentalis TaxID=133901 RepID=A0A9C6U7N9_FRAOC|nr:nephrin isoform X3 [Frankliniella occidentalis]
MHGDQSRGVFNLRISNASLEDDAEFQCQVSPKGRTAAIRANATLTVLSPPAGIEIINHEGSSVNKIEIAEKKEVELECRVKESKPAATIVWYRDNVELKLNNREDGQTEVVSKTRGPRASKFIVTSRIRLTPTHQDDGANYTCEAKHDAINNSKPMKATVTLSVLYPPGAPYIEGFDSNVVQRGRQLELICKSRGGNPLAQLIWYKNNDPVHMKYFTHDAISESTYTFTADASDNNAVYRCTATNIQSQKPLSAQVTVTVEFPPTHVVINGSAEARVGDVVPLTCTTDNSNPPAEIRWTVGGKQVHNATSRSVQAKAGGWITTSDLVTVIPPGPRSVIVVCHGLNMDTAVGTHTIEVQYPPTSLMIHGYKPGASIAGGTRQRITCVSTGGNPPATLTWFKNDKKISSTSKILDKSVSAEVDFIANATDNEARYKCEGANKATEIPLTEEVKLSVLFPPDRVQIKKEPAVLKPGQSATLTCDSSSSNPPAVLTWWRDGIPVQGTTNSSSKGLHGGMVSTVKVTIDVNSDLNGIVYTCQAMNEVLQRSVHDAITLDVLYKPIFDHEPAEPFNGVEGQPLLVALQAHGNPSNMTFLWKKDGKALTHSSESHSRVLIDGPMLNISSLTKDDTGLYTCEAANSEGATSIQINISVNYPARITGLTTETLVSVGEEATLNCTADGNPLKADHITWRREGFEMAAKTATVFRNNTSYLTIHKASKEDIGAFLCVVNNDLGNETSAKAFLLVKHKPDIDLSPVLAKAASNVGDTARLTCRAKGAPEVRFSWSRDGSVIPANSSLKYTLNQHKVDILTFESVLQVLKVEQADFGQYQCKAQNEIGFTTHSVKLDITSKPDSPTNLVANDTTHNSVALSWTPGFDGGLQTTFRIRYKPSGSTNEAYQYVDVVPPNATTFVIRNLDLATEYIFSAMAQNKQGSSEYAGHLKAHTTNEAPPPIPAGSSMSQGPWIVVSVAVGGVMIVLLNVLLISCCLRKHARKRLTAASEQSSSKSATIEMYAPSSYNETVTGETLSSVSEKSESYSNADSNPDYLVRKQEDGRKPAASTYLIDQIDYPFEYCGFEMQHQHNHQLPSHPHHHIGNNTLKPPLADSVNSVNSGTLRKHQTNYNNHNTGGVQPGGDGFYGISPDARYIAYPPPAEFSQPTGNGTLRRGQHLTSMGTGPVGVPPDVTVLHNPPIPPPPLLSTFSYPAMETEGHLV